MLRKCLWNQRGMNEPKGGGRGRSIGTQQTPWVQVSFPLLSGFLVRFSFQAHLESSASSLDCTCIVEVIDRSWHQALFSLPLPAPYLSGSPTVLTWVAPFLGIAWCSRKKLVFIMRVSRLQRNGGVDGRKQDIFSHDLRDYLVPFYGSEIGAPFSRKTS